MIFSCPNRAGNAWGRTLVFLANNMFAALSWKNINEQYGRLKFLKKFRTNREKFVKQRDKLDEILFA
jgi:hypothetical protein